MKKNRRNIWFVSLVKSSEHDSVSLWLWELVCSFSHIKKIFGCQQRNTYSAIITHTQYAHTLPHKHLICIRFRSHKRISTDISVHILPSRLTGGVVLDAACGRPPSTCHDDQWLVWNSPRRPHFSSTIKAFASLCFSKQETHCSFSTADKMMS